LRDCRIFCSFRWRDGVSHQGATLVILIHLTPFECLPDLQHNAIRLRGISISTCSLSQFVLFFFWHDFSM
jgi:hypothetical protein